MAQTRYSLRQVSDITGLSEYTLRGWESRYGAFEPNRTSTGRRLYSPQDIQRAMMLRELTKQRHRIGRIARLSNSNLNSLLDWQTEKSSSSETLEEETPKDVEKILKYVFLHDWKRLQEALHKARGKQSNLERVHQFFLPLLARIGTLVDSRAFSVSQEHIVSALLNEQISEMIARGKKPRFSGKHVFVLTTPERDYHEIGLLISHLLLNEYGIYSLYLGPNTPKEELCETSLRFGATHILLGSTISRKEGAKEDLYSYIHFLDRHLSPSVSVWLGGRNSIGFRPELSRPCILLASLQDLEKQLKVLRRGE